MWLDKGLRRLVGMGPWGERKRKRNKKGEYYKERKEQEGGRESRGGKRGIEDIGGVGKGREEGGKAVGEVGGGKGGREEIGEVGEGREEGGKAVGLVEVGAGNEEEQKTD